MPYLLNSQPAPTAEALMRSRYCAYVLQNLDYILQTWHPSTRPDNLNIDKVNWKGLEVITCKQGLKHHKKGTVEFIARFEQDGHENQLHEKSRFLYEDGHWYYCDGDTNKNTGSENNKTGRNQPCPCGSGLKFKRCCGKKE